MAKIRGAIKVETEICKGCNLCAVACPSRVISLSRDVNGRGYHYAYMASPDSCVGCANCALVCPDGVISVYKIKTN